jgi:hypothetical protein
MIAHRSAQSRKARFQRIDQRALGWRAFELDADFAIDPRKRSQMRRKHDADHGSV